MNSYKIECLSEAVSPLTHNSGTSGNESMVARELVHCSRGQVMVPFLSGNALRHRCVREPMALWLIDRYGLKGKLSLPQLNFLLHGGNLTESTASENTARIAQMHELWPMIRLCGGSLPDQILAGAMDVWRGVLVCEENRETLSSYLADGQLLSSERFISSYQYTRGDAKKTGLIHQTDDLPSNLMIYSGQCVAKGAMFLHGFLLKHVNEIELGCLLLSLRLWQSNGGTIGGNSRIGHGRLKTFLIDIVDDDLIVKNYVDYVDSVRDRSVQWLNDVFTPKSELKLRKKVKSDG